MTRKGKIISLIAILFTFLVGYGCSPVGKSETAQATKTNIIVNVELNTLVPDGEGCVFVSEENDFPIGLEAIELNITNNLQDDIITGKSYFVQVLKDGAWDNIPLDIFFNQLGLKIETGTTHVFLCNLHPEKYNYYPGEYRIFKEVTVNRKKYIISIKFNLCEKT